jgi:hypothetical protein
MWDAAEKRRPIRRLASHQALASSRNNSGRHSACRPWRKMVSGSKSVGRGSLGITHRATRPSLGRAPRPAPASGSHLPGPRGYTWTASCTKEEEKARRASRAETYRRCDAGNVRFLGGLCGVGISPGLHFRDAQPSGVGVAAPFSLCSAAACAALRSCIFLAVGWWSPSAPLLPGAKPSGVDRSCQRMSRGFIFHLRATWYFFLYSSTSMTPAIRKPMCEPRADVALSPKPEVRARRPARFILVLPWAPCDAVRRVEIQAP